MPELVDGLGPAAAAIGVTLSNAQIGAFAEFQDLLAEANRTKNLTSVAKDRYLQEHFIDSLTLFQTEKIRGGHLVADIGAGAGFPGLPLKIAQPDIELHLIEANAKKAEFLRFVIDKLRLSRAFVHQVRAEEAARQPDLREKMDVVAVRAVAALPVLLEYALPLCRVGGWLLSMKGPRVVDELEAARDAALELGGRLDSVFKPSGRRDATERVIVLAQKASASKDRYPRRSGVPAKRPLGG